VNYFSPKGGEKVECVEGKKKVREVVSGENKKGKDEQRERKGKIRYWKKKEKIAALGRPLRL